MNFHNVWYLKVGLDRGNMKIRKIKGNKKLLICFASEVHVHCIGAISGISGTPYLKFSSWDSCFTENFDKFTSWDSRFKIVSGTFFFSQKSSLANSLYRDQTQIILFDWLHLWQNYLTNHMSKIFNILLGCNLAIQTFKRLIFQ